MIERPWHVLIEGDVVLSRSSGGPIGPGIRFFTRNIIRGEPKSEVNHAGIITKSGLIDARITEALVRPGVVESHFYEKYFDRDVCVARPLNVTEDDRHVIAAAALSLLGHEYTERTLIWQALGLAKFLAPRFGDDWRICSWVPGYAFEQVEMNFGVDYRRADPDDIYDFIVANLGTKYVWVIPPTWLPVDSWESGVCLLPSLV